MSELSSVRLAHCTALQLQKQTEAESGLHIMIIWWPLTRAAFSGVLYGFPSLDIQMRSNRQTVCSWTESDMNRLTDRQFDMVLA
ncbi:hypothetical protein ACLKA6_011715 [Drosophila palustris]